MSTLETESSAAARPLSQSQSARLIMRESKGMMASWIYFVLININLPAHRAREMHERPLSQLQSARLTVSENREMDIHAYFVAQIVGK